MKGHSICITGKYKKKKKTQENLYIKLGILFKSVESFQSKNGIKTI